MHHVYNRHKFCKTLRTMWQHAIVVFVNITASQQYSTTEAQSEKEVCVACNAGLRFAARQSYSICQATCFERDWITANPQEYDCNAWKNAWIRR